jgi:L,D-transpeptidase YcbB
MRRFKNDVGSGSIMKKSASIIVSAVALLCFTAETVLAQESRPRRKGFFESIFGPRTKPRREFRPARDFWWEDDPSEVRVIRGPEKKPKLQSKKQIAVDKPGKKKPAVKTAFVDPEIGEGLGMGNLTYAAPKQEPVFDPSFAKATVADVAPSAIKVVLSDRSTNIRTTDVIRKAVLEFYKTNNFNPIWTENGNISARGLAVLDLLAKAGEEGLEPLRYKPVVLEKFDGAVAQLDGDTLGLAQFDVGLTVAALTYAQHQSGGAYEPEKLSAYHDLKPQRIAPTTAVRVLAYSPFPSEYLKGLAPTHTAYAALKSELAKVVSTAPSDVPAIVEGKRIRIGQKDSRIGELRKRLINDGFISLDEASVDPEKLNTLDKTLGKAVKRFQEAKGIAQTSNLDNATVKALNGPDSDEVRDKLMASMERLRWLPDNLGRRHVFVNQASYRVDVIEDGKAIWSSNVIVGKPLTQTAVFSDTFETVVFNPTWGVPQSIIMNEYLPKLRSNPGYLDKMGFKVVSPSGKVVSSRSVNWNGVGSNSGYGVVQPAGETNALGEVKFLFPNSHSIYMHDTPNRNLFSESRRNFSHGCVRVENPRDFASVLLKWDRDKVDSKIDGGDSQTVKVTNKTEVHLAYFTAWPDEKGIIQYYSDAYGRDATLTTAFGLMRKLYGGDSDRKVVQVQSTILD